MPVPLIATRMRSCSFSCRCSWRDDRGVAPRPELITAPHGMLCPATDYALQRRGWRAGTRQNSLISNYGTAYCADAGSRFTPSHGIERPKARAMQSPSSGLGLQLQRAREARGSRSPTSQRRPGSLSGRSRPSSASAFTSARRRLQTDLRAGLRPGGRTGRPCLRPRLPPAFRGHGANR